MAESTAPLAPRPGSGEFFDAIAPRYDLLNRILSFGIDRSWRRRTVRALDLRAGMRVLDLATGTADLAIEIARRCPGVEVIGLDPSSRMLEIGLRKVRARRLEHRVELRLGQAESVDLPDRSFDAITMAFGIRNVPDRDRALREMARLGRPGAPIAILELGEPRASPWSRLASLHIHRLVPAVGALLSGARAYRYLARSIAAFPPPEAFLAQMRAAGLERPQCVAWTFGVCHLYLARAPRRGLP